MRKIVVAAMVIAIIFPGNAIFAAEKSAEPSPRPTATNSSIGESNSQKIEHSKTEKSTSVASNSPKPQSSESPHLSENSSASPSPLKVSNSESEGQKKAQPKSENAQSSESPHSAPNASASATAAATIGTEKSGLQLALADAKANLDQAIKAAAGNKYLIKAAQNVYKAQVAQIKKALNVK